MKEAIEYKYPLRLAKRDARAIRQVAEESGVSINTIVGMCIRNALPEVREALSQTLGRITNVEPLAPRVARRMYAQADDDADSIRLFMGTQVKSVEE